MQQQSPYHRGVSRLRGRGGGPAGQPWACGAIASRAVPPPAAPDQSRAPNPQCQALPSLWGV